MFYSILTTELKHFLHRTDGIGYVVTQQAPMFHTTMYDKRWLKTLWCDADYLRLWICPVGTTSPKQSRTNVTAGFLDIGTMYMPQRFFNPTHQNAIILKLSLRNDYVISLTAYTERCTTSARHLTWTYQCLMANQYLLVNTVEDILHICDKY